MTRPERKKEIERVVEEGLIAYANGRSRHANPYRDANATWWWSGWDEGKQRHKVREREESEAESLISDTSWLYDELTKHLTISAYRADGSITISIRFDGKEICKDSFSTGEQNDGGF